jgi:hypothetical protein
MKYGDGELRYILAPKGVTAGDDGPELGEGRSIPKAGELHAAAAHPDRSPAPLHRDASRVQGGVALPGGGHVGARLTNKEGRWATLCAPLGRNPSGVDGLPARRWVEVGNPDQRQRDRSARPGVTAGSAAVMSTRGMAQCATTSHPARRWRRPLEGRPGAFSNAAGTQAKGGRTRRFGASASDRRMIRRRRRRVRYGQLKL